MIKLHKSPETLASVTGMSAAISWHLDCLRLDGARDTGDDNITSCSRFSVTVVRTVTRDKATQSSHAASPFFALSSL